MNTTTLNSRSASIQDLLTIIKKFERQEALPNVHLLELAVVTPITSVHCERVFSRMKKILLRTDLICSRAGKIIWCPCRLSIDCFDRFLASLNFMKTLSQGSKCATGDAWKGSVGNRKNTLTLSYFKLYLKIMLLMELCYVLWRFLLPYMCRNMQLKKCMIN